MANRQKQAESVVERLGTMFLVGQRGRKAVRLGGSQASGCEEEKEEEEFDQRGSGSTSFEDETLEPFLVPTQSDDVL